MRHEFNGQALVDNLRDADDTCTISIDGQSCVQGSFESPDGALVVEAMNGQSNLVLGGKCKAVRVRAIDGQSFLDLSRLEVGSGGVTIDDMNGQSRILCWTTGPINVGHADGQCAVFYKPRGKGAARSLDGQSRIVELAFTEAPGAVS